MTDRTIPYCLPAIEEDEIQAVAECMRSGWITTGGRARALEAAFCELSGLRHAVALNSCTAGLHLALAALGVGPGDEVIMPSLTFAAGAQCAHHLGAKPVFADVDETSLCITASTVEQVLTPRTRVVMPMQYGGMPVQIEDIVQLAQQRGAKVVEDAAHALGTLDDRGRYAGAVSDGAAYSFYATKNITTAEGGMFVTNDTDLADQVRILSLHGMDKDAWKRYELGNKFEYDVVAIGYKYNMPDILAAIGLVQLSKLDKLQAKRDILAQHYLEGLRELSGVRPAFSVPKQPARHSWCIFAVLIEDEGLLSRDEIVASLLDRGVGTSVHFPPTHLLTALRPPTAAPLPVTEWAATRLISLPLYPSMSTDNVQYVVSSLKSILRSRTRVAAPGF